MEIIQARQMDLPNILALQKLAYLSEAELLNNHSIPPLMQTIHDLEEELNRGMILKAIDALEPNKIIGSVRGFVKEHTLFIGKLMVHPDFQNRGLGAKLLSAIESHFPDLRYELFTSDQSDKNISLYTKNGYIEFKRERLDPHIMLVYLEKNQ